MFTRNFLIAAGNLKKISSCKMLRSAPESKSAINLIPHDSTAILGAFSVLMLVIVAICRDFKQLLPTDPMPELVFISFPDC